MEIPFAIEPLTAEANDFETLAGVIQFTPGLQTAQSEIIGIRDQEFETTESIILSLDLSQAKQGRIEKWELPLLNADFPRFSVENIHTIITDNDESIIISAFLSGPISQPVRVSYQTSAIITESITDYKPTNGYLLFEPGETLKTIEIPVTSKLESKDARVFDVVFYDLQNAEFDQFRSRVFLLPDVPKIRITDFNSENIELSVLANPYYDYQLLFTYNMNPQFWSNMPPGVLNESDEFVFNFNRLPRSSVFFQLRAILK